MGLPCSQDLNNGQVCNALCHTVCNVVCYIVCNTVCHGVCHILCNNYSTDLKKYMEVSLALFVLISILEQQDSNPVLLGEAFAAITCLTDISMSLSPYTPGLFVFPVEELRKEACRQHIYTKVLEAVSKHPRNVFLSEVAIEQLTILLHKCNRTLLLILCVTYYHYS